MEVSLYALGKNVPICPTTLIYSDDWNYLNSEYCKGSLEHLKILHLPTPIFKKYSFLDPPKISWITTDSLVPHESTSKEHLSRLINHLKNLQSDSLLPVIIVSSSKPHVILDGHHRWKSSIELGLKKVPCWKVDDYADITSTILPVPASQYLNSTKIMELNFETYEYYQLRVYDTRSQQILRIKDIADSARNSEKGFGIKGTKHVAISLPWPKSPCNFWVSEVKPHLSCNKQQEVRMEKVAPQIEWGLWKTGGEYTYISLGTDTLKARNFE